MNITHWEGNSHKFTKKFITAIKKLSTKKDKYYAQSIPFFNGRETGVSFLIREGGTGKAVVLTPVADRHSDELIIGYELLANFKRPAKQEYESIKGWTDEQYENWIDQFALQDPYNIKPIGIISGIDILRPESLELTVIKPLLQALSNFGEE